MNDDCELRVTAVKAATDSRAYFLKSFCLTLAQSTDFAIALSREFLLPAVVIESLVLVLSLIS